jgi:hypothetical protein
MKTALVMMPLDRMDDAFYVALLKDMDDSSYVALLKDMDDAIGWLKGTVANREGTGEELSDGLQRGMAVELGCAGDGAVAGVDVCVPYERTRR